MIVHSSDDFEEWFKIHSDYFRGEGYPPIVEEFKLALKYKFYASKGTIEDYKREERREWEVKLNVWINKTKIKPDYQERDNPRMVFNKPDDVCLTFSLMR